MENHKLKISDWMTDQQGYVRLGNALDFETGEAEVFVRQSRNFADELKDLGKQVEYIELENGDHYLSIQANRHAAFKAIDRFLKKHLKE